ncbi:UNVERIFIED_CONTAM: Mannose-P-dolichol utilization defect 1 protein2 [Sesamum latifolium]|uniref:Mannose-P-dolichol utilization defect 1 protein2 n=1 Tax=Sesamum latifolium TaxID=2727402 RepID=A0AAW2WBM5_9LAMI
MVEMRFLGMDFSCALGSLSNGEFPEKDCLLPLISKLLGYCIVAASTTVKLPQILKILQHRSIRGLSVLSFELEVVGYTIALAYCLHKGLPFSAYGELAFLLIQGFPTCNLLLCEDSTDLGKLQEQEYRELSFLTSLMNFGGSMVRVFTSIQEKAPLSGTLAHF